MGHGRYEPRRDISQKETREERNADDNDSLTEGAPPKKKAKNMDQKQEEEGQSNLQQTETDTQEYTQRHGGQIGEGGKKRPWGSQVELDGSKGQGWEMKGQPYGWGQGVVEKRIIQSECTNKKGKGKAIFAPLNKGESQGVNK